MKITKKVIVGSVESGDVLMTFTPSESFKIEISSKFYPQFGDDLKKMIQKLCREHQLEKGIITLNDQGALPAVVRARFLTGLERMEA